MKRAFRQGAMLVWPAVAALLMWSSQTLAQRQWPIRKVQGELNADGRIMAGEAASGPNDAVRNGELTEEIGGQVQNRLGEFRQDPATLAVAENFSVTATGEKAHAEGEQTSAEGDSSHAEGQNTVAAGTASHAEGQAEGVNGWGAIGKASHAEGVNALAQGERSHAEGQNAISWGYASHAEGMAYANVVASGKASHAQGRSVAAGGHYSHAEGATTVAGGRNSHAAGYATWADGPAVHAGGEFVYAFHDNCFVHAAGIGAPPAFKESRHARTAHFDRLYSFETWGEDPPPGAVLTVGEADLRYVSLTQVHIPPGGDVRMGCYE